MMLLRHFLPSLVRICFICCRIFSICNVIYSRIFSSSDDLHMPCGVSITLKYREHMRPHCRVLRLAAWWDAALLTGCRHWLILIFTLFFSLLFPEHRVSFSSRNPRPCIHVMFTCFSLVTCSPQPFVQLCRLPSYILPRSGARWQESFVKQESGRFISKRWPSSHRPVSATFSHFHHRCHYAK